MKKDRTAPEDAGGTLVDRPVGRLEPERTTRHLLTPEILEAEDAAGGVFAAGALVPAPVWHCPWCSKPAPGWRQQELIFGHRWEGSTKHYHCREAAVED